ncbi:hypothetical protein LIHA111178_06680 [Litorimonas haliclonae]
MMKRPKRLITLKFSEVIELSEENNNRTRVRGVNGEANQEAVG